MAKKKGAAGGTVITVTASCDAEHEIVVTEIDGHDRKFNRLQDGDTCEVSVSGVQIVAVREVAKKK